jgi:hypothetical protein
MWFFLIFLNIRIVSLILRMICFTTLSHKIENELRKQILLKTYMLPIS